MAGARRHSCSGCAAIPLGITLAVPLCSSALDVRLVLRGADPRRHRHGLPEGPLEGGLQRLPDRAEACRHDGMVMRVLCK